jgi:hypothetical protein
MALLHNIFRMHVDHQPPGTTMLSINLDESNTSRILLGSFMRNHRYLFIFAVISSLVMYSRDIRNHIEVIHRGCIIDFISKIMLECYPSSKYLDTICNDADILNKGYEDLYDKILERINVQYPVNTYSILGIYSSRSAKAPRFKIYWTKAMDNNEHMHLLYTRGDNCEKVDVLNGVPCCMCDLWRYWFNVAHEFDILVLNVRPMDFMVKRVMPMDIMRKILSSKTSPIKGNKRLEIFDAGMQQVMLDQFIKDKIMCFYVSIMQYGMQDDHIKFFKQMLGANYDWFTGKRRTPHSMLWIMEAFISTQVEDHTFFEYMTPAAAPAQDVEPQDVEPQDVETQALREVFNSGNIAPQDGMELSEDTGHLNIEDLFPEGGLPPNFDSTA